MKKLVAAIAAALASGPAVATPTDSAPDFYCTAARQSIARRFADMRASYPAGWPMDSEIGIGKL